MTTMNFDYMPGIGDEFINGFGAGNNEDLDSLLNFDQTEVAAANNFSGMTENFMFPASLTPNGMNINGGIIPGPFAENNLLQPRSYDGPPQFSNNGVAHYDPQSTSYPFPQQVDPASLMGPVQGVTKAQNPGAFVRQGDSTAIPLGSSPTKHVHDLMETDMPKPKRSRQSKKKQLTIQQQEEKRTVFLERNRVAAAKCRRRKQTATQILQAKAHQVATRNNELKQEIAELQRHISELQTHLLSHANCNDPSLKAAIEHYKSVHGNSFGQITDQSLARSASNHSFGGIPTQPFVNQSPARPTSSHTYGGMPAHSMGSPGVGMNVLNSGPTTPSSWEMQRNGSGMSVASLGNYGEDNASRSMSIHSNTMQFGEANQNRLADDNVSLKVRRGARQQPMGKYELGKEQIMSRQNSQSSAFSLSASSSRKTSSGSISATTTPEDSAKGSSPFTNIATLTGHRTLQNLGNPRLEPLVDQSLPGLSPMEFLQSQL